MAWTTPEGSVFAFQQDALLDVELQKAGCFVAYRAVSYLLWVQSEGCDCLGDGNSISVRRCQEVRINAPNQGAAADEGEVETHTLFLRERDQLDGEGELLSVQGLDQGQSQHHAQYAVEGSAIRDCIQVRTDHQSCIRGAGIAAAEITGRIRFHLHTCRFHPPLDFPHAIAHRRREKGAFDLARLFTELPQVLAAGYDFFSLHC